MYDYKKRLLRSMVRGENICKGEFYMITEIFIISNHKILVTLRSSKKKTDPCKWDIIGGHVQYGENSKSAAVREIYEEIGLKIKKRDLVKIKTVSMNNLFSNLYVIKGEFNLNEFILQEDEISCAKFVNREEFVEMIKNNDFSQNLKSRMRQCMNEIDKILLQNN